MHSLELRPSTNRLIGSSLLDRSYAGIYVPKLAQQILLHNDPKVRPQLKGFAVGDGCLGTESGVCGRGNGPWWSILFLYGHHQISTQLFDHIVETCGMAHLKYDEPMVDPTACRASLARVEQEKGGYFGYALYVRCRLSIPKPLAYIFPVSHTPTARANR